MAIKEVQPGIRIKLMVGFPGALPNHIDSEHVARATYEAAASLMPKAAFAEKILSRRAP